MLTAVIVAMMCASSLAQDGKIHGHFRKLQASKHHIQPLNGQYSQDCGKHPRLHIDTKAAALLQYQNVPGAGIKEFKPFTKVLKDGFLKLDCVKDYMYYRGDKFGDHKVDYKLGPVSNVSIVHYDAFVKRKQRAPMTQERCFEFCRTVPNMGFFGIVNGRGCYCTPYYTEMESDSTQCTSPCEGDNGQICGGEDKSSIFAMHMCGTTEEDLEKRTNAASKQFSAMNSMTILVKRLGTDMQTLAEDLQKGFGAVGDTVATGLMQSAKVFAGKLIHKNEEAERIVDTLRGLEVKAATLTDFSDPSAVTAAERTMERIDGTMDKAKNLAAEVDLLRAYANGRHEGRKAWYTQYHEPEAVVPEAVVPKTSNGKFTTGSGVKFEVVQEGALCNGPNGPNAVSVANKEACAELCKNSPESKSLYFDYDTEPNEALRDPACYCQATGDCEERDSTGDMVTIFKLEAEAEKKKGNYLQQYYPVMYFVDKKFKDVPTTCSGDLVSKPIVMQSADGCAAACDTELSKFCVGFQYFQSGSKSLCFLFSSFKTGFYYPGCGSTFLQAGATPYEAKCYAKLSRFEGTTLKPDPSGKCRNCFKDLTKADRCFGKR